MTVVYTRCCNYLKLSLVVLIACAVSSFGQSDTRIAFMSTRSGKPEIYIMKSDGSGPVQITESDSANEYPALAPGGQQMAYVSGSAGGRDIYSIHIDGSNPMNLSNTAGADLFPVWSPDGSKIAFTSERDGNLEIYVMDADGSNQINLTHTGDSDELTPEWSPDGSKISFVQKPVDSIERDIFVMNADGSNPVNLTNDGALVIDGRNFGERGCHWSPDGTKITYSLSTDGPGEFRDIWVMDVDGSNRVNLTGDLPEPGRESAPSWSPDGSQIVYYALHGGAPDIWIINADGTNAINLTQDDQVVDVTPSWGNIGGATLIEMLSWGRVKALSQQR